MGKSKICFFVILISSHIFFLSCSTSKIFKKNNPHQEIYYSVRDGDTVKLKYWISRDKKLLTENYDEFAGKGVSLLHIAAESRKPEILKILASSGGNVNFIESHGRTPLHIAAMGRESYEQVAILLRYGSKVSQMDFNSDTPLHFASGCPGDSKTIKLLIDSGADLTIRNRYEKLPGKVPECN